jgi:hemerythrin-like metal-binding domain
MIYQWDSNLETGNVTIDNQHKQLFAALNDLVQAYHDGKGFEELQKTFEFLTAYTLKHFYDEERLQEKYDYPDIANHTKFHNEFKDVVADLTSQLIQNGYNAALIKKTIKIISDWLINHIRGDDFRLAAYICLAESGGLRKI